VGVRFHAKARIHATLIVLIVALGWSTTALANAGPVKAVYGPAGIVLACDATEVGVVSEALTFDFRHLASDGSHDFAPRVTVKYRLKNPSPVDETLTIAFFYLDAGGVSEGRDFAVAWNGRELNETLEEYSLEGPVTPFTSKFRRFYFQHKLTGNPGFDSPHGDTENVEMVWLKPESGNQYASHKVLGDQPKFTLFENTVPSGQQGQLEVTYHQDRSGYDERYRFVGVPIFHYTYLLHPARNWAFFEDLTIRVMAPPGMEVATKPRLDSSEPGVLERTFHGLPEGDLHISVRPPNSLGLMALVAGGIYALGLWVFGIRYACLRGVTVSGVLVPVLGGAGLGYLITRFLSPPWHLFLIILALIIGAIVVVAAHPGNPLR